MDNSNPKIHCVKQSLVLHKDSKSHEKFQWDIYVALASQYSNNLSEETKKGLYEKAAQGWYPGNHKRGYKSVGDIGHKIWVIDEDTVEYKYIKKGFELYDTGNYTLRTLAKELFNQGWSVSGKPISISELHKLISDPFYCGEFVFRNKKFQGKHIPLISKELFYRVQDRLQRKVKAGKYRKHDFLLGGGFVICDECERSVTWEVQKGHHYGHCTQHKTNCTQKSYIREEALEEQIIDILDNLKIDNSKLLEWVRKALKEIHKDETDYYLSTIKELDTKLLHIEKRLSTLYDDRVDGVISRELYEKKKEQYETEASQILDAKEKHVRANVDYRELGINIFELAQKGSELYKNYALMAEKRELLNFVFSNLRLRDKKIVPTFQNGFQVVALRAKKGNWLPIVNSNLF